MRQTKKPDNPLLVSHTQIHQGLLPPAETLEGYARLVPDAPQRLLSLAEAEVAHRQRHERDALEAEIAARKEQLALQAQAQHDQAELQRGAQRLAELQTRKAFVSDAVGQAFGLAVALACVGGAVHLAPDQPYVAGLLAAIPSAAVIRAFFARGK